MKLIAKSVAVALLAGASVSAFAITVPPLPTGTPGPASNSVNGGGLWVEAIDTTSATPVTFLEYLGLNYADFNKTTATPDGGLTLDFGTLGGGTSTWSSFYNTTDTFKYAVFVSGPASTLPNAAGYTLDTTLIDGTQNLTATSLQVGGNNINQLGLSAVCPTGLCIAAQGAPGYVGGNSGAGQLNTTDGSNASSFQAAGLLGTSLEMFQVTKHTTSSSTVADFSNANGVGEWLLTAAGDLTYSIPGAISTVPIPAAVWLLASGL
ncbi:MAG TPA: hypothetical protein VLX90_14070, partial [Steroidobacteraceae bacterium]|nr:hypothetical protein [Steroidobacteraceae bacterium]